MKQMIEKKNKMLKEAGEAFKEIWKIYRMMDTVEIDNVNFRTLVELVNNKLARLSCGYEDYLDESELYLPEAEEDLFLTLPTEEEMAASREVNGDD